MAPVEIGGSEEVDFTVWYEFVCISAIYYLQYVCVFVFALWSLFLLTQLNPSARTAVWPRLSVRPICFLVVGPIQ